MRVGLRWNELTTNLGEASFYHTLKPYHEPKLFFSCSSWPGSLFALPFLFLCPDKQNASRLPHVSFLVLFVQWSRMWMRPTSRTQFIKIFHSFFWRENWREPIFSKKSSRPSIYSCSQSFTTLPPLRHHNEYLQITGDHSCNMSLKTSFQNKWNTFQKWFEMFETFRNTQILWKKVRVYSKF